ncbi:predicted protein [Ostreococcus lucimarinus CCE9901]|uniref:Oxidized purine nucleoside triphosphate hydrolase n=1 Tax=Ostreococcus lucimarinus (strain CCE9901) TaxID=436017 RepID=A4SAQ2_OSTLU|nr:predicted protein [Ostreococcus lucimarinus CCE9901]ABP00789.1 predicted protein [Ostreococcus lucimarinus CCE9901]|eukprot:XP_001422472.1 predicted protein [Ostreococcus lucimarinus CCE9901]
MPREVREGDIALARGAAHRAFTLVVVRDYEGGRVLLGEKLRGFGAGYYNGFGGKVERGETVEAAAARELTEEANVEATNMTRRGALRFVFDDKPLEPWLVHVFHCSRYDGEIAASDEMRPEWFDLDDVPFENMWADDPYWWPLFLEEKEFVGTFTFTNTTTLVDYWIRETKDLMLDVEAMTANE